MPTVRRSSRCTWGFSVAWKAGLHHKAPCPPTQRRNGRAFCGLSHIMADFRQIMWRKFLRNLCKYRTMAQKVLPHNLAWPFFPFLPSCCRPLSTAILCGRKRLMPPKVAPMVRQMVLPDNVAPPIFSQIFVGADTKISDQHIFGWSRHIMCQKWQACAGETRTFAGILSQALPPTPHPYALVIIVC